MDQRTYQADNVEFLATRIHIPLCLSVGRSVGSLSAFLSFLSPLLLPKCSGDLLQHCSCPPERDWGSRLSGLVFFCPNIFFYSSVCSSVNVFCHSLSVFGSYLTVCLSVRLSIQIFVYLSVTLLSPSQLLCPSLRLLRSLTHDEVPLSSWNAFELSAHYRFDSESNESGISMTAETAERWMCRGCFILLLLAFTI